MGSNDFSQFNCDCNPSIIKVCVPPASSIFVINILFSKIYILKVETWQIYLLGTFKSESNCKLISFFTSIIKVESFGSSTAQEVMKHNNTNEINI